MAKLLLRLAVHNQVEVLPKLCSVGRLRPDPDAVGEVRELLTGKNPYIFPVHGLNENLMSRLPGLPVHEVVKRGFRVFVFNPKGRLQNVESWKTHPKSTSQGKVMPCNAVKTHLHFWSPICCLLWLFGSLPEQRD